MGDPEGVQRNTKKKRKKKMLTKNYPIGHLEKYILYWNTN